jgi:hypothetical protein
MLKRSDQHAGVQATTTNGIWVDEDSIRSTRDAAYHLALQVRSSIESIRDSDLALLKAVECSTRFALTQVLIRKKLLLDEEHRLRAFLIEQEAEIAEFLFTKTVWPSRKGLGTMREQEREFKEQTKELEIRLRKIDL